MTLTKRHAAALGRLFGREIEAAMMHAKLPPVVKLGTKLAAELEELGFVEAVEVTFGGRFPVTISGYVLTWRGHMTYCAWAAENCSDDEP
jgi:hypothetical protein